jgi:pyroglutamyl-peptidase
MTPARPVILLTGFGPFPGHPENLTSRLVPELATRAARRFRGHDVVADVFPTEWVRAPERLAELYAAHAPKVALHFGVSQTATGFTLETAAFNRCASMTDATGNLPSAPQIEHDGAGELATRLPVDDIVAHLQALHLPVTRSADAGSYLCNTVFYRSLQLAAVVPKGAVAGFVHIPVSLSEDSGSERRSTRPFNWTVALLGSLEIIRVCLGRAPRLTGGSHA